MFLDVRGTAAPLVVTSIINCIDSDFDPVTCENRWLHANKDDSIHKSKTRQSDIIRQTKMNEYRYQRI